MTDPNPFDFGPPAPSRPPAGFPDPGPYPGRGPDPAGDYQPPPIDDFGHDTIQAYTDPYAIGGPPFWWLIGALGLAAIGAVAAAVLGAEPVVAFAAWAAAGPLAIGLLAVFSVRDTVERARMAYVASDGVRVLYWTTIVVAAVGIGISAFRIAEWAGRL